MAHENGKIYGNVEVDDVKSVLGASSRDIGTLCTHDNVNWASLKKPVRHPDIFASTKADLANTWYQGKGVAEGTLDEMTCGLIIGNKFDHVVKNANIIKTENSFTKANLSGDTQGFLYHLAKGTTGHFVYQKPQGLEAGSPYRLDDFRGYDHYAKNPMPAVGTSNQPNGIVYVSSDLFNLPLDVPNIDLTDALTNISLDSLKLPDAWGSTTLRNMYWGVLIYSDDLLDCMWVTQTQAQKNNNNTKAVTFVQNERCTIVGRKGKYNARTFFSNVALETNAITMPTLPTNNNGYILLAALSEPIVFGLLPQGTPPVSFVLNRKKETKTVNGQLVDLYYPQVKVTNNMPSGLTISSVTFNDGGFDMQLGSGKIPTIIDEFLGSTYFTGALGISDSQAYFKVTVVAGGNTYADMEFNGTEIEY